MCTERWRTSDGRCTQAACTLRVRRRRSTRRVARISDAQQWWAAPGRRAAVALRRQRPREETGEPAARAEQVRRPTHRAPAHDRATCRRFGGGERGRQFVDRRRRRCLDDARGDDRCTRCRGRRASSTGRRRCGRPCDPSRVAGSTHWCAARYVGEWRRRSRGIDRPRYQPPTSEKWSRCRAERNICSIFGWRGSTQWTRTLRNCQGSSVSMSSANSPGRPASGVQSV